MGRRKKCEQIKRTNNVMVRFTDAEYASISISAEQAGYPVAVYVRKSALDERIEVHYNITAELPELQKLTAEYSAIGNNLNQIAQYFHSGGFYSKSMARNPFSLPPAHWHSDTAAGSLPPTVPSDGSAQHKDSSAPDPDGGFPCRQRSSGRSCQHPHNAPAAYYCHTGYAPLHFSGAASG